MWRSVFLLAENRLLREALTKIFERKAICGWLGLRLLAAALDQLALAAPSVFGFGLLRRRLAPGVFCGKQIDVLMISKLC